LLASGAIDRQAIARRQDANRKANNQKTVEQIADVATTLLGIALGVAAVYYANDVAPVYYPAPSAKRPTPTYQPIPSLQNSTTITPGSRSIGISGDRSEGYESSFGNRYEYDLSKPGDRIRYEVDPAAQIRDSVDVNPVREVEQSIGQHGGGVLKD